MRHGFHVISVLLVVLCVGASAATPSSAQSPPPPTRIRGTIAAIDGNLLVINTRDGSSVKVTLTDGVRLSAVKALDMAAIKSGSFIGTAAIPGADGGLQSLEVVVFPEDMRGTGEGHYDWDLAPGSSMTNATVDAVVEGTKGRDLQLSYKGGSIKISVPPGAPIVTFVPVDRSALKVGLAVFTPAVKAADGSFSSGRVVVGTDGVKPPM
jgi:hypothetical protein